MHMRMTGRVTRSLVCAVLDGTGWKRRQRRMWHDLRPTNAQTDDLVATSLRCEMIRSRSALGGPSMIAFLRRRNGQFRVLRMR